MQGAVLDIARGNTDIRGLKSKSKWHICFVNLGTTYLEHTILVKEQKEGEEEEE